MFSTASVFLIDETLHKVAIFIASNSKFYVYLVHWMLLKIRLCTYCRESDVFWEDLGPINSNMNNFFLVYNKCLTLVWTWSNLISLENIDHKTLCQGKENRLKYFWKLFYTFICITKMNKVKFFLPSIQGTRMLPRIAEDLYLRATKLCAVTFLSSWGS